MNTRILTLIVAAAAPLLASLGGCSELSYGDRYDHGYRSAYYDNDRYQRDYYRPYYRTYNRPVVVAPARPVYVAPPIAPHNHVIVRDGRRVYVQDRY